MEEVYQTCIFYGNYSPLKFIIEGIDPTAPISTICLEQKRKKVLQNIIATLGLIRLFPNIFLAHKTLEDIRKIRNVNRYIVIENRHRPILKALRALMPKKAEPHLFLWTPVPKTKKETHRLRQKSRLFHLSSFDKEACQVYSNINIESSFYRFPPAELLKHVNVEYDCFFVGLEKGRGDILQEIMRVIDKVGLTHLFIINDKSKPFLPYTKTLEMLNRSRCVVDVTLSTKGISLRPMEALFFSKKLITNNPNIKQERLYHPDNVFIWGEDDITQLHNFVMKPFHPLPTDDREWSYWQQSRRKPDCPHRDSC